MSRIGHCSETEWGRLSETTFAGVYSQMASAYSLGFDATVEDLLRVVVKNHRNGAKNPTMPRLWIDYLSTGRGACPGCRERVDLKSLEFPLTGEIVAMTVIGQGGAPPVFIGQQRRDGLFSVAIVEITTSGGSVHFLG